MQVETWLIEESSDGRLEGLLLTQLELWLGIFRFKSELGDPDTDRIDALVKAFSIDSLSLKSGIDRPDALVQKFPTQILNTAMILTDLTVSIYYL